MTNELHILITKQLSGNSTSAENELINDWITKSDLNKDAYNQLLQIWNTSNKLKISTHHNTDTAWEDFTHRVQKKPNPNKKGIVLGIAATLILISVMSIILTLLPKEQTKNVSTVVKAKQTIAIKDRTKITQQTKKDSLIEQAVKQKPAIALNQIKTADSAIVFLLPDSTKVYLNKNSKLSYTGNYGKKDRKLVLEGEAYFEVRPSQKPFLVACGKTIIHDISTSFNVKGFKTDSLVEVNVISGAVEFYSSKSAGAEVLLLKEGSRGLYNNKTTGFEKTKQKKGTKWWKAKGIKNKIREYIDKIKHKNHS